MHTIENFEIISGAPQALISFHADDAPAWFGESVLSRRGPTKDGILTFEGVGPDGAFTIGFGPVTDQVEAMLLAYTQVTFAALNERGVAYAVELLTP
jgi:hypothetical protein